MGLIARKQTVEVSGLKWTFPRMTFERREEVLGYEDDKSPSDAIYHKLAACIGSVEGDDNGSPVVWPESHEERLDLLCAVPWADLVELHTFLLENVVGLSIEKQGNSDGQPSPLPGQE